MQHGPGDQQSRKQYGYCDSTPRSAVGAIGTLARLSGARLISVREHTEQVARRFICTRGLLLQQPGGIPRRADRQRFGARDDAAVFSPFTLEPAIEFFLGRVVMNLAVSKLGGSYAAV
jgi:hypothetical protein